MARVVESAVIDAPAREVWALLRDFNAHHRWHPAIADSAIEAGAPDAVGAVRRFRLADGGELREQLIALDDRAMRQTYCLLHSPLPLTGYVAELRLWPVTLGDRCFARWRSAFSPPPERAAELEELVRAGIYRAGFGALRAWFGPGGGGGRAPSPVPSPAPAASPAAQASARTAAIVVAAPGGPEALRPREVDLPSPGPGEVRLAQDWIGVNFIDVHARRGEMAALSPQGVPGVEAAGIVEAVGPSLGPNLGPGAPIAPGDRVAYAGPPGAYAARRNVPAAYLIRLPDAVGADLAAATLLKGTMAGLLLHEVYPLRAGETVLVQAAAGGVGLLLTGWAAALGARVIGIVGSEAKAEAARAAGADAVLVAPADPGAAVRALTRGAGADAVFDGVGRARVAGSLDAAAIRGHVILFGQASGPVGAIEAGALAARSLRLSRPNYAHYAGPGGGLERQAARLFAALASGAVVPRAPVRLPLGRAAEAHAMLEAGATIGAIILGARPDGPAPSAEPRR